MIIIIIIIILLKDKRRMLGINRIEKSPPRELFRSQDIGGDRGRSWGETTVITTIIN